MQSNKSYEIVGSVLSFDFEIEKLKKYYSKTSPQGAYEIMKRFLLKNGFEHLKDSDYVNNKLDIVDVTRLMRRFSKDNLWFAYSIRKINVSPNIKTLNISNQMYKDENYKLQKEKECEKEQELKADADFEMEM